MKKRIGIFLNRDLKMNAGGPSGYLYNLKLGLDEFDNNIEFFTKETSRNNTDANVQKKKKYSAVDSDVRLALSYILKGKKIKTPILNKFLTIIQTKILNICSIFFNYRVIFC